MERFLRQRIGEWGVFSHSAAGQGWTDTGRILEVEADYILIEGFECNDPNKPLFKIVLRMDLIERIIFDHPDEMRLKAAASLQQNINTSYTDDDPYADSMVG